MNKEKDKIQNPKTVDTVHTHTHTHTQVIHMSNY